VTTLDRYLARAILRPLAFAMGAFLTVAVVVDLFERLDTFIDHDVPFHLITQYYVATLPFLFIIILPISTLIAVLFSLGGMARRNELIAMTANGISLYRILAPVLVVGFGVSVVGLAFTTELVPRGNDHSKQIYDHEIRGRPKRSETQRRDLNYLGAEGRFFLARQFDGDEGRMKEVVVQQFAEGTLVYRIDADTADWEDDEWVFRSGYVRRFRDDGPPEVEHFDERAFPQFPETPRDFLRVVKEPSEMTLPELREHARRTRATGGDPTRLLVDEQTRYSFPFASFIVVLLGAPLTGAIRRGGHALGFGLALLVGFVYYVLLQIGETYGTNGTLPPWLAAWLPNMFFLLLGLLGLWKTRK
jgi:lipopolysaccharide export system permease protein